MQSAIKHLSKGSILACTFAGVLLGHAAFFSQNAVAS